MNPAVWRGREAAVLENDLVRLVSVPALGARVVSLADRRTGREWLVQGDPPNGSAAAWAAEDAVFGGAEAFGWDECLPTVAPCIDPLEPGGPPLRDHGDAWGRPAGSVASGATLLATWTSPRWPYVLRRSLRLDRAVVVASYELEVSGARALPFLWSMHALLALEPGSRLVLEPSQAAAEAMLTHHAGLGISAGADSAAWPAAATADGGRIRLDEVRGAEAGQAAKLYLDATRLVTIAARTPDGAELRFAWDLGVAPTLGIWLDYGGWPPGERRHQVALEPTTSPDDHLAGAIAAARAALVEPGRLLSWTVRLDLRPGRVQSLSTNVGPSPAS